MTTQNLPIVYYCYEPRLRVSDAGFCTKRHSPDYGTSGKIVGWMCSVYREVRFLGAIDSVFHFVTSVLPFSPPPPSSSAQWCRLTRSCLPSTPKRGSSDTVRPFCKQVDRGAVNWAECRLSGHKIGCLGVISADQVPPPLPLSECRFKKPADGGGLARPTPGRAHRRRRLGSGVGIRRAVVGGGRARTTHSGDAGAVSARGWAWRGAPAGAAFLLGGCLLSLSPEPRLPP